jgi:hypothetical protein
MGHKKPTKTEEANSVVLVCKQTIPTERPPLVGEVRSLQKKIIATIRAYLKGKLFYFY